MAANISKIVQTAVRVIFCVCSLQPGVSRAEDLSRIDAEARLPDAVVQALQRELKVLGSCNLTLAVTKQIQTKPRNSLTFVVRTEQSRSFTCIDAGRFFNRIEPIDDPQSPGALRQTMEMAFNGHIVDVGFRRGDQPLAVTRYHLENLRDETADRNKFSFPYLDAIGMSVPATISEWHPSFLESTVLSGIRDGKILEVQEADGFIRVKLSVPDRTILVAKKRDLTQVAQQFPSGTPPDTIKSAAAEIERLREMTPVRQVQFELDPKFNYAVRRREERTHAGDLLQTMECEDLREFPQQKIWLPEHCVIRVFASLASLSNFSKDARSTEDIRLQEVSFEKRRDVSFELGYGGGTVLAERNLPETDGQPSSRVRIIPETTVEKVSKLGKGVSRWWPGVGIAILLLSAGCAGWWVRRRK